MKGGIEMAKVFFEFLMTPYLFDTKESKLFQIKKSRLIEISDQKIIKSVRYNSAEIDQKSAQILAQRSTNSVNQLV